jgi:hypothetical protein
MLTWQVCTRVITDPQLVIVRPIRPVSGRILLTIMERGAG